MLSKLKSDLTAMERVNGDGVAADVRHDQYVQYNHEMTDDTAEASARTLIRMVPLVYGGLVGGIMGVVPLGLAIGLATTMALDIKMGRHSITLRLLKPLMAIFR